MTLTPTRTKSIPRWKVIHDQLMAELALRSYGSDFYTTAEVCEKFNVSQITAIRALNELASRQLIEKIRGKGSVVRQVAQSVVIRLIMPAQARADASAYDPALQRRIHGIIQAVTRRGIDFDTISESHLQSLFPRQGELCGFLVLSNVARRSCNFLRLQGLPYVLVDPTGSFKRRPHARVDRVRAGYLSARHLLDLGHRRIACIAGPINRRNVRDRLKGYRRALREAGIPLRWSLIKQTVPDPVVDRAMLVELMDLGRPPTAVIAGDDNRAIHILDACRQLGIVVPRDLSVLGYPNYPESRLTDPPLSVVDAKFEQVGEASVKLLVEQMLEATDPTTQAVAIQPELIQRGSTAPPPPKRGS